VLANEDEKSFARFAFDGKAGEAAHNEVLVQLDLAESSLQSGNAPRDHPSGK